MAEREKPIQQAPAVGREAPPSLPIQPRTAWNCLRVVHRGPEGRGAVAFAADGQALFTCDWAGIVRRHAMPGGEVQWHAEVPAGSPELAVSPDGRRLAASGGSRVLIFDSLDGRLTLSIDNEDRTTFEVCWSPDGAQIAVATGDNVRIFDATNGHQARAIHHIVLFSVTYVNAGDSIVSNTVTSLALFDVGTGEKRREIEPESTGFGQGAICGCALSPDGQRLAMVMGSDILIGVATLERPPVRHKRGDAGGRSLAWSPGGERLAYATDLEDQPGDICILDTKSGAELARYFFLRGNYSDGDQSSRLSWSPDGILLASSHGDGSFRLWDTRL